MWPGFITRGVQAVWDLAFPPHCSFCGHDWDSAAGDRIGLCGDCRTCLGRPLGTVCRRCARIVPEIDGDEADCFQCRKTKLRFSRTICLSKYDSELRTAVLRLKRSRSEALAFALAELLFAHRGDDLKSLAADILVPIPMHWRRRWRNGVNNPELLAEQLGRRLHVSVVSRSLVRRRHTPTQTGLSPPERLLNVRGAFAVRRGRPLVGRRILLIDDVMTTGATCNEATRCLLESGAAEVSVATLARA
jgi:ComF family protein